MSSDSDQASELAALRLNVRSLERERSFLIAVVVLLFAIHLVTRVGSRVYALAVRDSATGRFVEVAYLAQQVQVDEVRRRLLDRARAAHPVYRAADEPWKAAQARLEQPLLVRRVRRPVRLVRPTPADKGVDLPLDAAVEALADRTRVQVAAWAIYDADQQREVMVLATQQDADQALKTRLENVVRKVRTQLLGTNHLVGEPTYRQNVQVRATTCAIGEVKSVKQAVDYLSRGEPTFASHEVEAGENAAKIAKRYGVTVETLAEWNGGRDLKRIEVGDKLKVRRPEPPLNVLTVERRSFKQTAKHAGKPVREVVTVDIERYDGIERSRRTVSREPAR